MKAKVGHGNCPFIEFATNSLEKVRTFMIGVVRKHLGRKAPRLQSYFDAEYKNLFDIRSGNHWVPHFGNGLCMLSLARAGGYLTYERLAKSKVVPSATCPFCHSRNETIDHILIFCTAWLPERERYLSPLLNECNRVFAPLERNPYPSETRILLFGGKTSGFSLPHYYPPNTPAPPPVRIAATFAAVHDPQPIDTSDKEPDAESDSETEEDTISSSNMNENQHWETLGCFRVAGFFHAIDSRRRRFMQANIKTSRSSPQGELYFFRQGSNDHG